MATQNHFISSHDSGCPHLYQEKINFFFFLMNEKLYKTKHQNRIPHQATHRGLVMQS